MRGVVKDLGDGLTGAGVAVQDREVELTFDGDEGALVVEEAREVLGALVFLVESEIAQGPAGTSNAIGPKVGFTCRGVAAEAGLMPMARATASVASGSNPQPKGWRFIDCSLLVMAVAARRAFRASFWQEEQWRGWSRLWRLLPPPAPIPEPCR